MIKNILITLLFLICILEFINPKGIMPHRTFAVHDTVGVPVHDTVGVEVPVEVQIPVEVEKPVPYEVKVEVPVEKPIDTNAILNSIGSKIFKKDILKLPNNVGTITLFDTISNSRVIGRSFKSDIKQIRVKDTIYTPLPRKNELYFGVDAKLDKPNVINLIGVGLILKDKDNRHLYKLGIGVSNRIEPDGTKGVLVPYIGGGVYWRIQLRK